MTKLSHISVVSKNTRHQKPSRWTLHSISTGFTGNRHHRRDFYFIHSYTYFFSQRVSTHHPHNALRAIIMMIAREKKTGLSVPVRVSQSFLAWPSFRKWKLQSCLVSTDWRGVADLFRGQRGNKSVSGHVSPWFSERGEAVLDSLRSRLFWIQAIVCNGSDTRGWQVAV